MAQDFLGNFMYEILLVFGAILLISALGDIKWVDQFTTTGAKFILGILALIGAVAFGRGR